MSGIFQHHIPQSLIRGFRVPGGSKKQSKVWLYESGREPRLALVKKEVGGEPYFYSELSADGRKTLDDQITDYETQFDLYFQQLKVSLAGETVDPQQAAEVIAHLTFRNAHLRQTLSSAMQSVYSRSATLFGDETSLRPILGVDDETPSARLRELIDEQIARNPAVASSRVPAKVLYQIAQMTLQEQFNQLFNEQIPHFISALSIVASDAPQMARDAHNNSLASVTALDGRIQLLSALSWSVQANPGCSFILPDCVALGFDDDVGLQSLLMTSLKDVKAVLMPLSSTKMLAGIHPGTRLPNLQDFNPAAAASSHSFFVASLESEELKELQKTIATSTSHFMEETINTVFAEFAKEHGIPTDGIKGVAGNAAVSTDIEALQTQAPSVPNYSVNFLGCADQETAEKIAATLNAVVRELIHIMPLDRLDGVTFAHDYPAALQGLDRGFTASAPLQATNEEYGVGIAMAPLVVRNRIPMTHIVMRGDIGHCLINDDESQWRFGLHTVVQQLAHASSMQLLEEALPGVLQSKHLDAYVAFLYPCVEAAWEGYFSSRASAPLNAEAGKGYTEILVSVLRQAKKDILEARLNYHLDGDMDHLMSIAMPRINNILRLSAKVLGHSDGLAEPLADDKILADELEEAGLRNWFILFDSELSELWNRRGKWDSFDEFLHLNRHVERLFWQFRMIPWKTDDEKIWVEVLADVETQRMLASKANRS